ncbi:MULTISPECIES: hypothetical protein [unclassified Saccharopolyspora]|uniref:hypothetical protein n=1 Tax=unclassified Saccharopolyspora TaxID=2646250 RepID=UPI001CD26F00|nr:MULTISPECIES: hypothetical protein [unclassified Saccharopolyspora]MCA1191353.1 hypothetical protein [Saccharopolyspora sp. 6V]MCA1225045.1 hypothetical protein [Saccharopolyspora sp. 6M]
MSRHELPARSPEYDVIVGWDAPMSTFFGLVLDAEGTPVVDRGDLTDRIAAPGVVLAAVRDYAVIPPGFEHELLAEARADGHITT